MPITVCRSHKVQFVLRNGLFSKFLLYVSDYSRSLPSVLDTGFFPTEHTWFENSCCSGPCHFHNFRFYWWYERASHCRQSRSCQTQTAPRTKNLCVHSILPVKILRSIHTFTTISQLSLFLLIPPPPQEKKNKEPGNVCHIFFFCNLNFI